MNTYISTNGIAPSPKHPALAADAEARRKREDQAFARALDTVKDTTLDELFSTGWLHAFHKEIFGELHEHAGTFRNEPIRVAWHIPPAQTRSEVEDSVEQYIADSRSRLALALLRPEAIPALIGYAFWKLTYIAPFADGNGRVANGLSILLQRRFDLPGIPLYSRDNQQEYAQFVHLLRAYDTGNAAPFFEYLRDKLGMEG